MADHAEEGNAVVEQQEEPKAPIMAETEEQHSQLQHTESQEHVTTQMGKISIKSFSIWPPTQRTRDAVINRLIETLSASSVLSKRYGSMPQDEAEEVSRRIEDEAYVFAAASATADADADGMEILQVYSKDISTRMLDAVKSRSASDTTQGSNNTAPTPAMEVAPATSEEISSVESE